MRDEGMGIGGCLSLKRVDARRSLSFEFRREQVDFPVWSSRKDIDELDRSYRTLGRRDAVCEETVAHVVLQCCRDVHHRLGVGVQRRVDVEVKPPGQVAEHLDVGTRIAHRLDGGLYQLEADWAVSP